MIDPLADDDDDDALRALGRRAREQLEARPEAWEAVARGEREADEVASERLAAGDSPEAVARARALFRPPDEAEHAAMVDALLAQQRASREPAAVVVPAEPAANDSGRAWWLAGLALAAALALVWWLVPGRSGSPGEPDPPVLAVAPLPLYELQTDGGLTAMRSAPAEPASVHRYRVGSRFEWIMRPGSAAEGQVGVRLFAFGEGTATALAADDLVELGPTGSVRVTGPIEALGLARGAWTIAIVVGRPSALPSDPAAVREADDTEGWQVERLSLVLED